MSELLKEIANINDVYKIKKIQFSVLSPEDITNGSVCEILTKDTYDGNEPKLNGLFDPRMGVIEKGRVCPTCGYTKELCPGHFGHIVLAMPCFYIQFIEIVRKILSCVDFRSSVLLIDKSDANIMKEVMKRNGEKRFSYVYNLCKKQTVKRSIYNGGAGVVQPHAYKILRCDKIKTGDSVLQIMAEFKPEAFKDPSKVKLEQYFTPEMCLQILKRITKEDCEILGFDYRYSRPEWFICTVLPVPPPHVRPSVKQDNNQRMEDDLTHKLSDIVGNNRLLKQKIEQNADKKTIDGYYGLLQYDIATYIDNEIPNIGQAKRRSGLPLKVLAQRLGGKDGRVRNNLMGKRVDYSARTVISCDPNISIDEWGVPYEIAMNLTYPVYVTNKNKNELYRYVRNGPEKYPGAVSITKMKYDKLGRPSPITIYLKYRDRDTIVLEEGDIVRRHVIDGDIGLFNRQPSLHRMSMMGHKVRVLPGKTFRLNISDVTPYNADFDKHLCQKQEA